MREIKFRAWDDVLGMCEVIEIDFMSDTVEVGGKKTTHHYVPEEKRESYTLNIENANLMQYTGLKDKNGIEIYEGDVVSFEPNSIEYPEDIFIYEVVWFKQNCSFLFKINNDRYDALDVSYQDRLEVIGNIYENPELLKDRKA
ncbi:MAG: YopX family protein [Candidatus Omnitrophota bacterium]|jgi:uncharacterized phage protein (TIGR01671 family)